MKIVMTHNAEQTIAAMRRIRADQVPFAVKQGIAATALKVKEEERAEMARTFDRPTPWTLNSVFMKSGTKADPTALVWLKDERAVSTGHPAAKYLAPQIHGGARALKGFERMLARRAILPPGWQVVPGAGAKLDAYGNMSRGEIVKVLSWFQTFSSGQGYTANATAKTKARRKKGTRKKYGGEYFAALVGDPQALGNIGQRSAWKGGKKRQHLTPGIYEKTHTPFGSAIRPIMIFVDGSRYRKRYAFFEVAERVVAKELVPNLRRAFVQAVRTAR